MMANGISVFAEHYNGKLEPVVAELVTAAKIIQKETGEPTSAILVYNGCDTILDEIKTIGVDRIYVVKTEKGMLLQDDALSQIIADMVKEINPSGVLIPATPTGRSIFSRTAVKLGCGLTADCTELLTGIRKDGSYYIKQNKPSYGDNVIVTIITKESCYPQMVTVRPGVYEAADTDDKEAEVIHMDNVKVPESGVEVLEVLSSGQDNDSILSAEAVVVGGRGAAENGSFDLIERFADVIGAAIGGTRPMVDTGLVPFDHQIGQTGYTIRPKICISLGVSGAIQHTEGLKDVRLFIAVNTDENAAVFRMAHYGMAADLKEVLESYLAMYG